MRKFAKMLILFVTLFVTATLFPAEQPTFETICRQLASYRNTTGEFTQIKTTSLKKSLKSSGSFI